MNYINEEKLILEKEIFTREEIDKRMRDGGFNSLAKFELFIWDLEMFLQLQNILQDKTILKGGAATQFYIPITGQRTSIDIDMICLATKEEVQQALRHIENELNGEGEYCKFRRYEPNKPRVALSALETYFVTIPSICSVKELYTNDGKQEVKIEFLYLDGDHEINKIRQPELFALETKHEFNILNLQHLFADKLTTLGPGTIGIPEERADEQFKQIYDLITLFISNMDHILTNRVRLKELYEHVAKVECKIHDISYDEGTLFTDMKSIISKIKKIEIDLELLQRANDFQSVYLRRTVNRDKAQWAIVGFQLDMIVDYIFHDDKRLLSFRQIEELLDYLKFEDLIGPERGKRLNKVRTSLEENFSVIPGLTQGLFKKRLDRILWELSAEVPLEKIKEVIEL